jgi:hypothetical protein
MKKISRRDFLKLSLVVTSSALAGAACGTTGTPSPSTLPPSLSIKGGETPSPTPSITSVNAILESFMVRRKSEHSPDEPYLWVFWVKVALTTMKNGPFIFPVQTDPNTYGDAYKGHGNLGRKEFSEGDSVDIPAPLGSHLFDITPRDTLYIGAIIMAFEEDLTPDDKVIAAYDSITKFLDTKLIEKFNQSGCLPSSLSPADTYVVAQGIEAELYARYGDITGFLDADDFLGSAVCLVPASEINANEIYLRADIIDNSTSYFMDVIPKHNYSAYMIPKRPMLMMGKIQRRDWISAHAVLDEGFNPGLFAVDNDIFYWAALGHTYLHRGSIDENGKLISWGVIDKNCTATCLAVDNNTLYWVDGNSDARIVNIGEVKNGGLVRTGSVGRILAGVTGLWVDKGIFYWYEKAGFMGYVSPAEQLMMGDITDLTNKCGYVEQQISNNGFPKRIYSVDQDVVYWKGMGNHNLRRGKVELQQLSSWGSVDDQCSARVLVVDKGNIYWVDENSTVLRMGAIDGYRDWLYSTQNYLDDGFTAHLFAVDHDVLYWAAPGSTWLHRGSIENGRLTSWGTIDQNCAARVLAVDNGNFYWSDSNSTSLYTGILENGQLKSLGVVDDQCTADMLVVDNGRFYWRDNVPNPKLFTGYIQNGKLVRDNTITNIQNIQLLAVENGEFFWKQNGESMLRRGKYEEGKLVRWGYFDDDFDSQVLAVDNGNVYWSTP